MDLYFWDCFWPLDGFWFLTIVSNDNSGTENIWFDFYNPETATIYDCNEIIFFDNDAFDYGINLTIDSPVTDVSYDLVEGWNWISFYRNPNDSSISSVFDDLTLVPDVLQVKNQTELLDLLHVSAEKLNIAKNNKTKLIDHMKPETKAKKTRE